ncbi:MAG: hypothetical protein EA361_15350 [Bacteroidetes bacterium]|nr:MAG: hypothetical protein EA361_15350 [Bacteroidota bacterium]
MFFSGCAAPKETARDETVEVSVNAVEESDTTVHELLIFDSDFDRWFARNSRPISFYDHQYLKRWNATLTREWNTISAPSTIRDCRPVSYLDYDSGIDYGKELDYKLFYYFRYMHQRCRLFSQTPGQWR